MGKAGWRAETMERKMNGGPLTLEKYHRFFADPWGARVTIDHLNHILSMHGFVRLHRSNKKGIMKHLVGQVNLKPPRRSTVHTVARPSAAASIGAAQAAADVDAIGWTECPIGSVAVFAGYGEDPPERLEHMPPPADHVLSLVVRRARSKRTRGSAYPRRVASEKAEVKDEDMDMDMEDVDISQPPPSPPPLRMRSPTPPPPSPPPLWMRSPTPPPPSPPPLWMRSPTPPPPPPSPPLPQTVVSPTSPSSPCSVHPNLEATLSLPPSGCGSPPPPGFSSPPPPGFGSPPPPCWSRSTLAPLPTPPSGFVSPPPPCWQQPTLAPLRTPPTGFGSPQVTTPPPQLSWGLPMVPPPSGPGAPPTFTHHPSPPLWRPTVPPSYPAPCWGAPTVLPPPQAVWRWPHPPPRWAPPHMQQQHRPPPPWGCMEPSALPPMPPQHQPHFEGQQWPQPPGASWPVF